MNKYWISWYSGCYEDEGCTTPPFDIWYTGQRGRENNGLTPAQLAEYNQIEDEDLADEFMNEHGRSDGTVCAMVEANSVEEIWVAIAKYYPDYEERFCELRPDDDIKLDSSRFQGGTGKVSLYE